MQGFVIYDYRDGELPDFQELNTLAKAAEGEGKQAVFIHEDLTALNAKLKGGRAAVEENEIPGLSRATPTTGQPKGYWRDSTKKLRTALLTYGDS